MAEAQTRRGRGALPIPAVAGADSRTETILLSFRSISVALLAVIVLLGPATRRPHG